MDKGYRNTIAKIAVYLHTNKNTRKTIKMTILKKIFDVIIYISVGFTVMHGLLFLLIITERNLYATVSYHYSNNIMWYVLLFGLPLMAGIAFYFWMKKKNIPKGVKIFFGAIFILQLTFSFIATSKNREYWGYSLKRPTVFKELSNASTILACSKVANYDSTELKPLCIVIDTTDDFENLYGRQNFYYGNLDRPFMLFQDNAPQYSDLYYSPKVYKDTNRNISENELLSIDNQIKNTGFIDKGEEKSYYDHLGQLNGLITKFQTTENEIYIFAGLKGREVANDHYPFYEFLFIEDNGNYNLIKKQKYYTDIAGIEGLEYANIAPLFSLLLSVVGIITLPVILLINRILKRKKSI